MAILAPAPEPRFVPIVGDEGLTIRDTATGRIAEHDKPWTEEDAEYVASSLNGNPGYAVCWDWVGPDDARAVA